MCQARCSLFLLMCLLASQSGAAPGDWRFEDVTDQVVDTNPPGKGIVFDYTFVDINDDNYLDIVLNNHHQSKPSPIWLGTPDHRFRFWQNLKKERHPEGRGLQQ